MEISFGEGLLVIGLLLAVGAGLSGLMKGTVLSISVLSVTTGIALAELEIVEFEPTDAAVVHLIELALILTLFSDGLFVERELLRIHWTPPARAIALAMPVTPAVIAAGGLLLFPELTVAAAFLLAAALTQNPPLVASVAVPAPGGAPPI